MKNIATYAHSTGARCQFGYKRLTVASTLGYHPPVSAKKALIGFGHPKHPYDASRRTPAVSAASLSVPPVMVARWEARKGLPVPARGVRLTNPSSHRHRLVTGAVVFANHTPWRPHMAQSLASTGAPAQIFAHPNMFAPPVQQGRLQGRHPKGITLLWRVRNSKRHAADRAAQLVERIDAYKCAIAEAEGYAHGCRLTLAELTQAVTAIEKGAAYV
jgi:hypothetical protein